MEREEFNRYYEKILKKSQQPDDKFPKSLFTVIVNYSFGDTYYTRALIDHPIVDKATMLKKRYNNPKTYEYAIEVYEAYIDYLMDKYNLPYATIEHAMEEGAIDEPHKTRPKLKKNKYNNQYRKLPVPLSLPVSIGGEFYMPPVNSAEVYDSLYPIKQADIDELEDIVYSLEESSSDKEAKYFRSIEAAERRHSATGGGGYASYKDGLGLILGLFENAQDIKYDKFGQIESDKSFVDLMFEEDEDEDEKVENLQKIYGYERAHRNGVQLTVREAEAADLYITMNDNGWNIKPTPKASDKVRKVIEAEFESRLPLSKKEIKKMNKKNKKNAKELRKLQENSGKLTEILMKAKNGRMVK